MFNEIQAQLTLNTIATCIDDHNRSDSIFFLSNTAIMALYIATLNVSNHCL